MQVTWVWSLVRKVSWSRKWQPTPVFLPGKFHGQRSLAGYNPWGPRVRHKWATEHVLFTIIWSSDLNFIVKYTDIVQFSHSVVSNSFRPCGLQHARFPVHHQLPEFTQTHVHWVGDAIQSSHPLLSPSPPAFKLSQYQSLFQWVSSLHQVAKLLEFQFQHQSFQWIFRTDFLQDGLVGCPFSPRDSQESSPTPQFKSINSLALSFLDSPTLTSIHD